MTEAKPKTKSTTGGRRAGSGRKPLPGRVTAFVRVTDRPPKSFVLQQTHIEAIDQWRIDRNSKNNSEALRQIIEHACSS